ncbi:MAG: amino acid permease [Chloroflexi bacterium]|nr:amino acid permease [Chloroflexota bacterium]
MLRETSAAAPVHAVRHVRRGQDLNLLDFTLLVIGAVIGADVYVVAAIGAGLLGPAQLVAWLVAGALAALIGVAFVQCAAIHPRVGGSYAYARAAFGPFVGFAAGWALYVGEWIALPVFPVAFANYLMYFIPDLPAAVGVVFAVVRPTGALEHLTPFTPLGWSGFGASVLVIFWAYAGFELAVLPAAEVQNPARTLPRGLIVGMATATLFYVLTAAAVVVALPWSVAAGSQRSLADALDAMLAALGAPGVAALVLSNVLDLTRLIDSAMFFLGICYVLTGLAALRLVNRSPQHRLHIPGLRPIVVLAALSGFVLAVQAPPELMLVGAGVMCIGVMLYVVRRSAWRTAISNEEHQLEHWLNEHHSWLLHFVRRA